MATTVKAVHSLKAGGKVFGSGELVEIADDQEAERLVERGAAEWPGPEGDSEVVASSEEGDGGEEQAAPKKSRRGKK